MIDRPLLEPSRRLASNFLGLSQDPVDLTEEEEAELRKIAEEALFKAFDKFKEKWPTMNEVFKNFPQIYCEPMN